MYKFLLVVLFALSLNSCMPSMIITDDMYNTEVSYTTIIRNGIPYYIDGALIYYLFNNRYYYPYYYEGYYYFHGFDRPMPPGFRYHPSPRFRPDERLRRPNNMGGLIQPRGNRNVPANRGGINRPNGGRGMSMPNSNRNFGGMRGNSGTSRSFTPSNRGERSHSGGRR